MPVNMQKEKYVPTTYARKRPYKEKFGLER